MSDLKDEIKEIKELLEESTKKKPKKFRVPFKGKVGKGKLKKGYITVVEIKDNMTVSFRKEPIIDSTFKMEDTTHAVEDFDIFSYKGKPLVFQPKKGLNPWNPLRVASETYGQKYVMAKMKSDLIKAGKKKLNVMTIFIIAIVLIGVYYFFTRSGGAVGWGGRLITMAEMGL